MNTEIYILAYISLFLLILTIIQGTRNVLVLGLPTAAGNQHDLPAWDGWNDRLNRAIKNLIEALAIFAPIIIAVHVLGLNNETSILGAQLFLIARLIHAPVFIFGIPWLRTTAWFAGVAGILMTSSALFI